MGQVSFAICEAALEAGATVACGVEVGAIDPAHGVELEDGTIVRAPTVVCNADPKVALRMLGQSAPEDYAGRLREWKVRSPVMKVNAALRSLPAWTAAGGETWPALGTVDVTDGLDACQRAFERYEDGEAALGYAEIYCQTAADPSPAPPGGHLISAFCQYAPYEADGDADALFAMIERHAPGFGDLVIEHEVLMPADIESRIGLTGGNIFQGECLPDQMWERRLSARTPVDGLYLCGAATHPGGSVIGLNGRNAARAVLADAR